jgi:hypothetical protein
VASSGVCLFLLLLLKFIRIPVTPIMANNWISSLQLKWKKNVFVIKLKCNSFSLSLFPRWKSVRP